MLPRTPQNLSSKLLCFIRSRRSINGICANSSTLLLLCEAGILPLRIHSVEVIAPAVPNVGARRRHSTVIKVSQNRHAACLIVASIRKINFRFVMNVSTRPPIAAVSATDLELSYGQTSILNGIDFSLSPGQTLALLGPSGCGKTTLLRLIAGLLSPTYGSISIGGQLVADAAVKVFRPPERRGLGMVFQDYALWPHMTVAGNVAFPLEMRGVSRSDRDQRTLRALERVGLSAYAERRPSDLSGGQQQRVAIARAIVAEPSLILFDEPLSNLDRELRETMVDEIGGLISSLGLTAVYVTHDHGEAFSLADQVAIMRKGRIDQLGSPDNLVDQPANQSVADFLRLGAIVPVERAGDAWVISGSGVSLASGHLAPPDTTHALLPTNAIEVGADASFSIPAFTARSQFRSDGHLTTACLAMPDSAFEIQFVSRTKLRPQEQVSLRIDASRIRWFSSQDIG